MIWIYQAQYNGAGQAWDRNAERELGRRLLERGLWERYQIRAEGNSPVVETGEHGKPYLRDYPLIHFNISHTKGLVACGLGDISLGVDVERIRPFKDNILPRVLAKEELLQLENAPRQMRQELFFRFWTLKESYVKAAGCGITVPLSGVSFSLGADGAISCSAPGYWFWQRKIGAEYILSCCGEGETEGRIMLL